MKQLLLGIYFQTYILSESYLESFFGELFVGESYLLQNYLECSLVSCSESYLSADGFLCFCAGLSPSLSLSFFFVGLCVVNNSENYLCAVGFYVCVLLCVCSKEMTLPRGGESQEGNNVRQWVPCDRNSYNRY